MDRSAYIESITDAYSQYSVNDIESILKTINRVKSANYQLLQSLKQVIASFYMVPLVT